MRIKLFIRENLSRLLLATLVLFYAASGFSAKSFGYAVVLLVASLLFIGCGIALYTGFSSEEKKGGSFRLLQLAYWLILFTLFCYFIQIDYFWTKLFAEKQSATLERLRQIIQICYFAGIGVSLVGLLIQATIKTEAKQASSALLLLGGLLFFLVAINYWAHIRPAAIDLTLMRKFSLSSHSRALLAGVDREVKITAFYPFFSDLYRDVELMLRDAASANGKISYTFIDPLREKNLADEKKVDRIGTILIETVDPEEKNPTKKLKSNKFEILEEDALKRLERELVSNILQISGKRLQIYYLAGHDEKTITAPFKDDSIESFDENLRALRHSVKQLTPAEGFPQKMPAADMVLVIGPRKDLTRSEKAALKKYFDEGGKLFVALDPESAADFSFLLEPLKVKFVKQKIHSDWALQPGKTTLQTMNYSEHAITSAFVKRPEERKLTIWPGAGYLETSGEANADYDVNYFLLSHFSSWIDKIANGLRDDKKEPIASFKMGMAVKAKKNSGRLVFIGDSDFIVNRFIDMQQNKEIAMRAIAWLAEDDQMTGIVPGRYDDEKVKLTGTRDSVVFHLFLYIYPGIILLIGIWVVRAKRRRIGYATRE